MNNKNIIVNFYDKHNRYIGKFIPNNVRRSSLLLLKQVMIYNNKYKRLNMAKCILKSEIYHQKSNLKYYNRRYNCHIEKKIKIIEDMCSDVCKYALKGYMIGDLQYEDSIFDSNGNLHLVDSGTYQYNMVGTGG
mgnify:CR=1 FL=1